MCVVCRRKAVQSALVRVRVAMSGAEAPGPLLINESGPSRGRGAYVCRRIECWTADTRLLHLERALGATFGRLETAQIDEFTRAFVADAATREGA